MKYSKIELVRNFIKYDMRQLCFGTLGDKYCMHCGYNVKYGPFLKRLFVRKQQHGGDNVFQLIENEKQPSS